MAFPNCIQLDNLQELFPFQFFFFLLIIIKQETGLSLPGLPFLVWMLIMSFTTTKTFFYVGFFLQFVASTLD